ncbi:uncharacterized protein LOC121803311 isoform X1 [Salvia splendens]|uniref:uncharacterized protein LOC121803311 isoform X1 n=1 Tax=Salvia splendens TaxID=180675 RepID=UPI001C256C6C|nr:uncharacterized protein LOC121803311 isoform X1 [Salvia splendens]
MFVLFDMCPVLAFDTVCYISTGSSQRELHHWRFLSLASLLSFAYYLSSIYVLLHTASVLAVLKKKKACPYSYCRFIEGCSDMELSLEDSRILANCISGQIYDSDPIEFTKDLGARFALRRSILRMPGLSKLVSLVAKGVTSSLDALFITRK